MKHLFTTILVIIGALTILHTGQCDTVRRFGCDVTRVRTPFSAEVILHIERKGRDLLHCETLVWYESPERYRLEMADWPGTGLHNYHIRTGNYTYSTIAKPEKPNKCKWGAYPAFWMDWEGTLLDTILRDWRMRDATLVEVERLHGIPVEHWRGKSVTKKASDSKILDLWLSTDPRFPLVIKAEWKNSVSSLHYEISNLRLGEPVPGYIFTSQVHPRGGVLAQMKLPYKPLWMILVYYALFLLACIWLIRSLMKGKNRRGRSWHIAVSAASLLLLLCFMPDLSHYLNHLSGMPVLLVLVLMCAAALTYCWRRYGMPGDVRLFSGTPWHLSLCAVLMIGLGLTVGYSRSHAFWTNEWGLADLRPVFLPQTLVSVLVYAAIWAALEEVVGRGYIMGLFLRRFTTLRLVNVLQALVFTAWHIPKFVNSKYSFPAAVVSLVIIFVWGLLFGVMRLKCRNLGAGWIVHTAYNMGHFYGGAAAIHAVFAAVTPI